MKRTCLMWLALLFAGAACASEYASSLEHGFLEPPDSARPWVYWFWLNGNITSNGITADLQAMQRVGIGGVLIMEVDQGAPKGPAPFGSPPWRGLFQHVCSEAHRLGLEVNMNNDAGWCGSGGPWITPDLAMQKVVWSETTVQGPRPFESTLKAPPGVDNYYEDIAVLAFPTPVGHARLEGVQAKAAFNPSFVPPQAEFPSVPPEQAIATGQVTNLSACLQADGRLAWDVPPGNWTILRFGHTTTGKDNHPAPEAGRGLECDKLSRKAVDVMFNGLMAKLIADSKPLAGKSLVSTHIDSWEVGSQNWTPLMRQEFRARRGYDLLPYLPALTGRIVGSTEVTERFLWDLRQTISELVLSNYAGHFRELAHRHGLRLSIEAYTSCPVDELAYAGQADEPMGEFWSWPRYMAAFSCTEMASAAHVYGKPIVGAEAFTASDQERWQGYPGNIKELGDWAFCEGINRFVFHRYALQPWIGDVRPGMSMGPWGLHYERTETWWEQSRAWHTYLARCQFLLQQGRPVADICLLSPEGSPQTIDRQQSFSSQAPGYEGQPFDRPGHNFDLCPPEVLLSRMTVKHGRLALPDGPSYAMLALPRSETMTPRLLRKVRDLVRAGATIVGARPLQSPSLSGYPACDAQVKALADELWGPNNTTAEVTERRCGKGHVIYGARFDQALARDHQPRSRLGAAQWIWFKEGNPAVAAPVGPRYFRKSFQVESGALDQARLVLTADNGFECWVNGRRAGAGEDFTRLYELNLARLLKPGTNLLAIRAVNGAEQPNPAGLIGQLTLRYHDGHTVLVPTDRSWEAATQAKGQWRSDLAQADGWSPALELGPPGMAPWGEVEHAAGGTDLYPDIDFLNQLLTERGLAPDFAYQAASGEQCLRYIHKRLPGAEVYFVANKTPEPQVALCTFRVRNLRPDLWDPQTGEVEQAAVYDTAGDCVRTPLQLDAYQSVFVMFSHKAKAERGRILAVARDGQPVFDLRGQRSEQRVSGQADVSLERAGKAKVSACVWQPGRYELTSANGKCARFQVGPLPPPLVVPGPWNVVFAPGGGAPPQAKFEQLISWTQRPEPGIKYYSGTATYTRRFAMPEELLERGRRVFLDLGKVDVMADVRLNGQSLGTLWKAPYRVEITRALKPGQNTLAVKVANLWINRQIGDEWLPEDSERNPNGTLKAWPNWLEAGTKSPTGRYSFSSWRLWKKDSPLQESGLLGPVRLLSVQQVQASP